MSEALDRYREMSVRLLALREANGGEESPEEDALLDEMDFAWAKLTLEDLSSLRGECAT